MLLSHNTELLRLEHHSLEVVSYFVDGALFLLFCTRPTITGLGKTLQFFQGYNIVHPLVPNDNYVTKHVLALNQKHKV